MPKRPRSCYLLVYCDILINVLRASAFVLILYSLSSVVQEEWSLKSKSNTLLKISQWPLTSQPTKRYLVWYLLPLSPHLLLLTFRSLTWPLASLSHLAGSCVTCYFPAWKACPCVVHSFTSFWGLIKCHPLKEAFLNCLT